MVARKHLFNQQFLAWRHMIFGEDKAWRIAFAPGRSSVLAPLTAGAVQFLAIAMLLGWGQVVKAQTVATSLTSCPGTRISQDLSCSAGEFTTIATLSGASGTLPFCVQGSTITVNVVLELKGSKNDRYDPAFYIGVQGNDPRSKTLGNICSGAIVPSSLLPSIPTPNRWFDEPASDGCLDLHETQTTGNQQTVTYTGVTVQCIGDASGQLQVPYVLTYLQNQTGSSCTVDTIGVGAPSKCNAGNATLQVNTRPVLVSGYVDVTKQTVPDGDTTSFSFTATGPLGSIVGYSTDGGTTIVTNNTNSINVSLTDGKTARIYMSVISTDRTLTITENSVAGWDTTANISCAAGTSSTPTTNNATRTISTPLSTTKTAASCTVTNRKLPTVAVAKNSVGGYGTFNFTLGGLNNATDTVTTSSTANPATSTRTNIGAIGVAATVTETPVAGYATSYSCTDANAASDGVGAGSPITGNGNTATIPTTGMVAGAAWLCTFTNRIARTITVNKTVTGAPATGAPGSYSFSVACGNPTVTYTGTITLTGASTSGSATVSVPDGSTNCRGSITMKSPACITTTSAITTQQQESISRAIRLG